MKLFSILLLSAAFLASCSGADKDTQRKDEKKRIVSLGGTITEIIYMLGEQGQLVAVDITSTYPAQAEKLTNLGHVRGITGEVILSQKPTHVLAFKGELKPAILSQLKAAKTEVVEIDREFSVNGAKKAITQLAGWFGKESEGKKLCSDIDRDLSQVKKLSNPPGVLFIYARGAGTLMVAGDNSQVSEVIKLAGGMNAATGFEDFKPLTAEAVIAANPDVLLMFDSGVQSLAGETGVFDVPGVAQTTAGKNHALIAMDGQFLTGFSPRVGKAIAELNAKLSEIKQ